MKRLLHLGLAWAVSASIGAAVDSEVTSSGVAQATDAPTYDITIFHPRTTGEQMHVVGLGTQVQVVNRVTDGQPEPSRSARIGVAIEGDATVRQVDPSGRPVEIAYRVDRCAMTVDAREIQIAAPGTVITASLENGSTVFRAAGRQLGRDASTALRLVASLENDGISDDDLLGSATPRGVGESWGVNVDAVIKRFSGAIGRPLTEDNVSGAVTLVDVREQDGLPCLLVHGALRTDGAVPGIGSLPAGYQFGDGRMKMTMQQLLPRDESLPSLMDSERMDVDFVVRSTTPSAGTPELRYSLTRVVEIERTPVMAAGAE